jgi:hypothetical protein
MVTEWVSIVLFIIIIFNLFSFSDYVFLLYISCVLGCILLRFNEIHFFFKKKNCVGFYSIKLFCI